MTAVLAEYVVTDDHTLLFLVRPDVAEPEVVEIGLPREKIRTVVADAFAPRSADRLRAADAAVWREPLGPLVAPLAAACAPGDVVWLVPGDVLHYVPMHALHVGLDCLAARNPVCYTPSASVMRYCRANAIRARAARPSSPTRVRIGRSPTPATRLLRSPSRSMLTCTPEPV